MWDEERLRQKDKRMEGGRKKGKRNGRKEQGHSGGR